MKHTPKQTLVFKMTVDRLKILNGTHERIVATHGADCRQEYVRTRRSFMEVLGEIRKAVQPMEQSVGMAPVLQQLRRMTTALALHQADWPVIAIDLEDAGYKDSMRNVRRQLSSFFAASDGYLRTGSQPPAPALEMAHH